MERGSDPRCCPERGNDVVRSLPAARGGCRAPGGPLQSRRRVPHQGDGYQVAGGRRRLTRPVTNRVRCPCCPPGTLLIQPQRTDVAAYPPGIKDLLAVVPHRAHHRAPADTEVERDPSDVGGVLADSAGALNPGPLCQHRPRTNRRAGLDQVRWAQRPSPQRQTRLSHTTCTGRLPQGGSRTQRGRRSCSVATTPHRGQPVTDSLVSTSISSSPPYSAAASTTNPGNPNSTVAVSTHSPPACSELPCPFTWSLRFPLSWSTTDLQAPGLSTTPGSAACHHPRYHAS